MFTRIDSIETTTVQSILEERVLNIETQLNSFQSKNESFTNDIEQLKSSPVMPSDLVLRVQVLEDKPDPTDDLKRQIKKINNMFEAHDDKFESIEKKLNLFNQLKILDRVQTLENEFKETSNLKDTIESHCTTFESQEKRIAYLEEKLQAAIAELKNVGQVESLRLKMKNQKKSFKTQISDLKEYFDNETKSRKEKDDEYNSMIESIKNPLDSLQQRMELEFKMVNKKMLMLQSSLANKGDSGSSEPVPVIDIASSELSVDVEQLKLRLSDLEANIKTMKEDYSPRVSKLETQIKENKEDINGRLSNMEYVSSKEREEFMSRLQEIDDRSTSTAREIAECPRMITNSIETNQIALKELSEKIESKLSDMNSKLKQASFADEEIEELRMKFNANIDNNRQALNSLVERIEKTEHGIQRIKGSSEENSRLWASVNSLNMKMEVQEKTTNVEVSNIIRKLTQKIQKLKNKLPQQNEEDAEVEEIVMPDTKAAVELLRMKIESMEQEMQNEREILTKFETRLTDEEDTRQALDKKLHEELKEAKNDLISSLVDNEQHESLKNEMEVIRNAINSNIETSVEERKATKHELKAMMKKIDELSGQAKVDETEREEVEQVHSVAPNEIKDLKLMMNGIELSAQRQIRKLKRTVKNIERALEDAEEEEKKHQEIGANRKNEEQQQAVTNEPVQVPQVIDMQKEEPVAHKAITTPDERNSYVNYRDLTDPLADDFNIFFVLMFAVLLYFLVSDLFIK